MPKLTIDHRDVEVPEGATVLDAARKLGIDIPALCFRDGCSPSTSCLACLVRIGDGERLVPSCATRAAEGMRVESETEAVHQARRTALELLLSDHLGDCMAPCHLGCPAQMDIPTMLRHIAAGQFREAIATVKTDIALPAVLGRICPAPCEKTCRRGDLDAAVSICLLKRLVADVDLASSEPYSPPCKAATGKHVAIIGAGPTGLSAAYYLAQFGHTCDVFDENQRPGGRLLRETTETELPRDVIAAEVATIERLGVVLNASTQIAAELGLAGLRTRFDAVLLACGITAQETKEQTGMSAPPVAWGLPVSQRGIQVTPHTFETGTPGVFAAGGAVRGKTMVVRSVADGKEAAIAIDQFLCGSKPTGQALPLSVKIGRMHGEELADFAKGAASIARRPPAFGLADGFSSAEGVEQASRCLHCDCRGATSCKLRKYAAKYGADTRRFKAERRVFLQDARHAEVIYEPGKCIDCGLCIQIAAAAGEPLGLTFVGRGFDVRVAVPLDRSLAEALLKAAAECVAACPTAALAWKSK
jgi:NADPH-dependent 2,4-dienoyl-CoA reductase/sulfur reductase-like enzyme/ferredoxin